MIRSRAAVSRTPAAPPRGRFAPLDTPARSQDPAAIRGREQTQACPGKATQGPDRTTCGCWAIQVRRLRVRSQRYARASADQGSVLRVTLRCRITMHAAERGEHPDLHVM